MENDAFPVRVAMLPFVIGAGLAFGQGIAGALIGPELPRNNDVAGAGAAIMFYLTFASGFVVTLITIVIRAVLKRQLPTRPLLRGGVSVLAGALIGALAWSRLGIFPIVMTLV